MANNSIFPIEKMCKVLKVSRSSYYSWLMRKPGKRDIENNELSNRIKKIYEFSKRTYGSPRVTIKLLEEGLHVSRQRVARLMKKQNLKSIIRKKWVITTNSRHNYPVVENKLNRNFNVTSPGQVWVSDITYIKTLQGWLYLTVIIDLYDRKVIGWSFFSSIMNETEIQNKGWEFYIKAQPLINPIKWTFDFNISFNKNNAISEVIYTYGIKLKDQPAGNFYGHQFAGYSATNQMLVYDDNGNTTTNWIEYKKLGNGAPKSFLGFTNNFEYNNFELSIFVRGALGFDINNFNRLDNLGYMNFQKTLLTVDQRDIINYSRLQTTDYILEKGGYIKIANISLGYTIPIEKRFIKSAKVFIACNNIALFTKASDVDPEIAGITGLYPGNYYYEKYPKTRIFLLGLKVLL